MLKGDLMYRLQKKRDADLKVVADQYQEQYAALRDKILDENDFFDAAFEVQQHMDRALKAYQRWAREHYGRNGIYVEGVETCAFTQLMVPFVEGEGASYRALSNMAVQVKTEETSELHTQYEIKRSEIEREYNYLFQAFVRMDSVEAMLSILKDRGIDLP